MLFYLLNLLFNKLEIKISDREKEQYRILISDWSVINEKIHNLSL
tara:strand:- start:5189 stop:5323 length:135 start_codon:yes stop_codon:yes gene_type:complete